ncbi:MAG: hypothetical protein OCD02_19560 [Spirochaetaceae bacterium]
MIDNIQKSIKTYGRPRWGWLTFWRFQTSMVLKWVPGAGQPEKFEQGMRLSCIQCYKSISRLYNGFSNLPDNHKNSTLTM